jgi:hypothetical protein
MTMAFRPYDLQEAFFVPGTHAYRVWGYGTLDALEEVLQPGYFAAASSLLRPGQMIYVSARRHRRTSGPARELGPEDVHMALLMVAKAAERGGARSAPSVRLVQDFGCPDSPAALASATIAPLAQAVEVAPIKRGRGRPPGSRTRKSGALPAMSVN